MVLSSCQIRFFPLLCLASMSLGCSYLIPEHLRADNVLVKATTPKIGSRVPYGTMIGVKVKYRVDYFKKDQPYYLLVCGSPSSEWESTCGTRADHVVQIEKSSGTVKFSFSYTEQTQYVVLVAGQPKVVECPPGDAWCTRPSTIGASGIPINPPRD
jgi:hypothetical protein